MVLRQHPVERCVTASPCRISVTQVALQAEESTAPAQDGTATQFHQRKPQSSAGSEGQAGRQWRREPRSNGGESTSDLASTLYQKLEALSNAGNEGELGSKLVVSGSLLALQMGDEPSAAWSGGDALLDKTRLD